MARPRRLARYRRLVKCAGCRRYYRAGSLLSHRTSPAHRTWSARRRR